MIVGSDIPLVVGQYCAQYAMTDNAGQYHPPQPFVVLREATYDEWRAEQREGLDARIIANVQSGTPYFYLISID